MRMHGNPSDPVATKCITTALDAGESSLFPDAPVVAPKISRRTDVPPSTIIENLSPVTINSLEDFVGLRRLSTRSSVPLPVHSHWALQVKHALQKALNAPDDDHRNDAVVQFMLLPTRFLPANASTSRVVRHLREGCPFNVAAVTRRGGDERKHSLHHRISESITRLANDGKLRAANKLLAMTSETSEMPFTEKVESLKSKLNSATRTKVVPPTDIPMFSTSETLHAIRSLNRQAATAIDGWTRDHLEAAVRADPSIVDDLGAFMHLILTQPLSDTVLAIIRAGRMVPISKKGGGIRPVAIANVLSKLCGAIAIQRDARKTSTRQYAISKKNGAPHIIHEVRDALDEDSDLVVIKFDIRNAFNELSRDTVAKILSTHDATIRQYFRTMYGGDIPMAVYGSDEHSVLQMINGVRQGDATSTYLFCHCVDVPLQKIAEKYLAWMFVDDLSLVVHRGLIDEAILFVKEQFAAIGLVLNEDKTKVFDRAARQRNEVFTLLGADLAGTEIFETEQINKQMAYFDQLRAMPLHPHLKFSLLRFCGSPRVKYLAGVMPPLEIRNLLKRFSNAIAQDAALIVDPSGSVVLTHDQLHSRFGLGIPDISGRAADIFKAMREEALTGINTPVELVTPTATSIWTADHNVDAQWLFFKAHKLTPADFTNALAIRLGFLPKHLRLYPCRCDCGTLIKNDKEQIIHTFACDMFTAVTHTTRHNALRDTVARMCNAHGLTVTKEPTNYTYADGKRRPDLTVHGNCSITTDFSIVSPDLQTPGVQIDATEKAKSQIHSSPVQAQQHTFIPAVFEIYGLFGKKSVQFISTISGQLPPSMQFDFKRDLIHEISCSLARSRSAALIASKIRRQTVLDTT